MIPSIKTYSLRKKRRINYIEATKRQPKSVEVKAKEKRTKATKELYNKQEIEVHKKFNNKFNPIMKQHRYPTRQQNSIPCERYNKSTMHKDIMLRTNKATGRKSALNGFLQHAYSVWDPKQQKMLEFTDLINNKETKSIWTTSLANELGRLSQGIRDIKKSNCIKFIYRQQVPRGRNVTYARLVVDYRLGNQTQTEQELQ